MECFRLKIFLPALNYKTDKPREKQGPRALLVKLEHVACGTNIALPCITALTKETKLWPPEMSKKMSFFNALTLVLSTERFLSLIMHITEVYVTWET